MGEWKEFKLGSLLNVNQKSIGKDFTFTEIEYLDTGSITLGKIESFQNYSVKDAPSRARRLLRNNDIIYSTVRPIQRHYGIIKNPKPNTVVSTGFAVLSCDQRLVDPHFIYYFLTQDDVVNYLDSVAEGSTSAYPSLTPDVITDLEIILPELPEQRAIASILSSLDDKIDLLHRQNKTLEQLAETLFRQWFVEEADESWEVQPLGNLVTVKRGGSPRPIQDYLSTSGLRWLKISDVTSIESPFIFEIKEHIKEDGLSKTVFLNKGSIVLSNSATPGIPKLLQVDTCIHDGWLYFPKSYFSNEFLYLLFNMIRPQLLMQGNGSIFTNLKTDIIKEYKIAIPPEDHLLVLQTKIKYLFDKQLFNTIQIRTLTKLRDTLLPKLMSGEVRV